MKNVLPSVAIAALFFATDLTAQSFFSGGSSPQTASFLKGVTPNTEVSVKIVARKLDGLFGGIAKAASDDAVHYHAVVTDSSGNIIDNFGWSNESGPQGHFFSESNKRFADDYDPMPRAEAIMTYADYLLVKNQFAYNERRSGYSFTNNGVTDYHAPEYKAGRENFNCQFAMSRFWQELQKTQSFSETTPFSWPDGNVESLTTVRQAGEEAIDVIKEAMQQQNMPMPSGTVNLDPASQVPHSTQAENMDDETLLKILTENGPATSGIILSTMQNAQ